MTVEAQGAPGAERGSARPRGMTAFVIVWAGQVVSLVGTAMSGFALTLWAYNTTGMATALAMVAFFNFAPTMLMSPVAGVLVDRWNRKWTMALSDMASALATAVTMVLLLTGRLALWHLFVAGAFTAVFQTFQWPAYSAAITMMVPKQHLQRANGMIAAAENGSGIAAPVLAGALIGALGFERLWMVLLIDLFTFITALAALSVVAIPNPPSSDEARGEGMLRQSTFGFRYIWQHRPLFNLQMVFFGSNLLASLCFTVLPALILARTSSSSAVLGWVQSAGAAGGLAGSIVLMVWGGPKRKVRGVLAGLFLTSILGTTTLGLARSTPAWIAGAFLMTAFIPVLNGSNQAIWQSKVHPALQGRVFSVRLLLAQVSAPIGMLASGPLADKVFGPAMMPGGHWAQALGWVTGTGPGAGMSVMFILFGLAGGVLSVVGHAVPSVRNVEDLIPDADAATASAPVA